MVLTVNEWMIFLCCVLAVLGGLVYPMVFLCVLARKRIKTRREKRRAVERKLKFTLPDRENTFVRARLNTVLREIDLRESGQEEGRAEKYFCMKHAKKMLNEIKNAPLSVAERLEIMEISALFELYFKKTAWNTSEIKALNEAFARVLKLSAKHSVVVG
ncbi:MAG: hypothetical protein E7381_05110 [Clostridiales bacterium]|nr:hypothetical protein [Clostridiales bacterium]